MAEIKLPDFLKRNPKVKRIEDGFKERMEELEKDPYSLPSFLKPKSYAKGSTSRKADIKGE